MYKVVTIAREYGSGGSDIGHKLAQQLGWRCIDKQIIERVAELGKVDPSRAEASDELTPSWWDRVLMGISFGAPEFYVEDENLLTDRDKLQRFTARVIEEAAHEGDCVIIGRSAQCVLRRATQALHVLTYAPLAEKLERMKLRHPDEADLPGLLRRMDAERGRYAENYYGRDWRDLSLYHLCVNSTLGVDACAQMIADVVRGR